MFLLVADQQDQSSKQQRYISHLEHVLKDQQSIIDDLKKDVYSRSKCSVKPAGNDTCVNRHLSRNEPDRTRATTEKVAFAAVLNNDNRHIGLGQIIPFDNVVTNIGNAFHPHSNVFIAPVTGVYVFFVSIMNVKTHFEADIVRNGARVARAFADGLNLAQGATATVVHLNVNDEVSVKLAWPQNTLIHGNGFSSFSGFLLSL